MTGHGHAGEAIFRVRDHGPGLAAAQYEATLAADVPVRGWGPSPWEALRDLVRWHAGEFDAALAEGHREIDAFLLLGDWRAQPGDELLTLTCLVFREPDRVPIDHEPSRIAMPVDAIEVRELAHWLLKRWSETRGLKS